MQPLHPEAEKALNAIGDNLVAAVKPRPPDPPPIPGASSDAPVIASLTEADIEPGSMREFVVAHTGERIACYFEAGPRGVLGLDGESHQSLAKLAQRISASKTFADSLSEEFVYHAIIDWLQAVSTGTSHSPTVMGHIEAAAASAVREYEIWLPLPVVHIPHPIQIGSVVFRRITKTMMDEYAVRVGAGATLERALAFQRERSRLQATTAASLRVKAEPIKAAAVVESESEAAIAFVRLSCPQMMGPYKWAPIDPTMLDGFGASYHVLVDGGRIVGGQSSVPTTRLMDWTISPDEAKANMSAVWGYGHNLIVSERTDFQELLLASLIHYSKSILKADVSERLLYVVTALESLFVRQTEPIVQNLRERMAMISGSSVQDRISVMELITRVYDLRSRFVHGALPAEDMALLERFFFHAWTTFYFVLANHNKWRTKVEFVDYLDSYKLRGPEVDTSDREPI